MRPRTSPRWCLAVPALAVACSGSASDVGPHPGATTDNGVDTDTAGAGDTAVPGDSDEVDTGDTNDTNDTNDTGTGPVECVDSERVVCFPTDIGPAVIREWETTAVLTPGKILVFPFSHGEATDGEQYGNIATVGATGADTQGHDLRAWHSREPGGVPLEGDCAWFMIADGVYRWNQNKDFSGYCRLPDTAGTVYWNYALCRSSDDDFHCAGAAAEFAPEDYRFHIAPRVIAY